MRSRAGRSRPHDNGLAAADRTPRCSPGLGGGRVRSTRRWGRKSPPGCSSIGACRSWDLVRSRTVSRAAKSPIPAGATVSLRPVVRFGQAQSSVASPCELPELLCSWRHMGCRSGRKPGPPRIERPRRARSPCLRASDSSLTSCFFPAPSRIRMPHGKWPVRLPARLCVGCSSSGAPGRTPPWPAPRRPAP